MTLSEAANRVIDLAGKVRAYYDTELPKHYPHYPLVDLEAEERVPPPPEERELQHLLASLPDELIYQLMTLVHLGRGKAKADDLAGYPERLKKTMGTREDIVSWLMMDKAILADQMTDGLEELRRNKLNLDKLSMQKVKVRKR